MPVILPVKGISPRFGKNVFLAPNATVVGEVVMGDDCSVWFNAVVRGDVNSITIGNKAIIHGCTIQDNVLIGMGSIIMDGAEIGSNSIIAAGAIVLENTKVEQGVIYAGIPARKLKDIPQDLIHGEIERIANNYIFYADWFRN